MMKIENLGPQQIVIADRGWVFVGRAQVEGDCVRIENARCVRYWGTTRGLGELADGGPTKTTKLDPMGTIVLPARAVIGVLACKSEW